MRHSEVAVEEDRDDTCPNIKSDRCLLRRFRYRSRLALIANLATNRTRDGVARDLFGSFRSDGTPFIVADPVSPGSRFQFWIPSRAMRSTANEAWIRRVAVIGPVHGVKPTSQGHCSTDAFDPKPKSQVRSESGMLTSIAPTGVIAPPGHSLSAARSDAGWSCFFLRIEATASSHQAQFRTVCAFSTT